MRTIAAIFIPALVGLSLGGGFGYFKGQPFGVDEGKLIGACEVTNTAVAAKVLAPEQAEKLGSALAAKVNVQGTQTYTDNTPAVGVGCPRLLIPNRSLSATHDAQANGIRPGICSRYFSIWYYWHEASGKVGDLKSDRSLS